MTDDLELTPPPEPKPRLREADRFAFGLDAGVSMWRKAEANVTRKGVR